MQIIDSKTALQETLSGIRQAGHRLGLVPTMGNLHAGHLQLVSEARRHCDYVLTTIFVNPAQFGPGEDLERYPRTLAADTAALQDAGCDALFCPSTAEIYPEGSTDTTIVSVPLLSELHCGASRPGHFDGVCTVVSKLFNMIRPDLAFFGEKDYQQLFIIRKMVNDLCMPVNVIGIPTVREASGLALSSRNGYLSEAEKQRAPVLYRTLQETRKKLLDGPVSAFAALEQAARASIDAEGLRTDYFTVCSARTLLPASSGDRQLVILAAAWLGQTRLIDNICVDLQFRG